MIRVPQEVLHAKMLEYFHKVEEEGEELIVTHNEVPVIHIMPLKKKQPVAELFADVRGRVKYQADLLESEWEV